MSDPAGDELLLFVAGMPGEAESQQTHSTLLQWFLGANAESRISGGGPGRDRASPQDTRVGPEGGEGPPWHLPREMMMAIQLVCEAASRVGRHVRLVDVNRAGPDEELVQRWVGAGDIFPLLIRPGGGRMEGTENFTRRAVRRFVEAR